jgi:hypothetical protein
MKTLTIPARTIAAGVQTMGPVSPNQPWTRVAVVLDIANVTPAHPLIIGVDWSHDGGVTWELLVRLTVVGPSRDKQGVLQPNLVFDFSLPDPFADRAFRFYTESDVAFVTAGGSVVIT